MGRHPRGRLRGHRRRGAHGHSRRGPRDHGGLDATLEQISADAIENDKKELFFRVRLRTDKNFLVGKQGEQLPIIPGMTATVDILTGNKTVLEYLMKPILKARETALTER